MIAVKRSNFRPGRDGRTAGAADGGLGAGSVLGGSVLGSADFFEISSWLLAMQVLPPFGLPVTQARFSRCQSALFLEICNAIDYRRCARWAVGSRNNRSQDCGPNGGTAEAGLPVYVSIVPSIEEHAPSHLIELPLDAARNQVDSEQIIDLDMPYS